MDSMSDVSNPILLHCKIRLCRICFVKPCLGNRVRNTNFGVPSSLRSSSTSSVGIEMPLSGFTISSTRCSEHQGILQEALHGKNATIHAARDCLQKLRNRGSICSKRLCLKAHVALNKLHQNCEEIRTIQYPQQISGQNPIEW